MDPPHPPQDNPTGEYRREFVLDSLAEGARWAMRFEGVDSHFTVWLNGTELGWATGSRLPVEFDATLALREGRNVLAVRVHQWSAGSYLEDQDMWWLSGIFRSVHLIERPAGGIGNHFVHADFDHRTGEGLLLVECDVPAVVDIPELGVTGLPVGEPHRIAHVEPWTAETPRLYVGTLRSEGETVTLSVGFRTVRIVYGMITVNGSPIRFRGVNRHEWHPETGRTLDLETMRADVLLPVQREPRRNPVPVRPQRTAGGWAFGEAEFTANGELVGLGELALVAPRLDLWRAPTDNDRDVHAQAQVWRELGLHRLVHRTVDCAVHGEQLVVDTVSQAAGQDGGIVGRWTWTAYDSGALELNLDLTPAGQLDTARGDSRQGDVLPQPATVPKLGIRLGLPGGAADVGWYGYGPGESYRDSRRAARLGRFHATVEELQTPYVRPQENGNRSGVREAAIRWADGQVLHVTAPTGIDLSLRPWTAVAMDTARHTSDLVPDGALWLTLDLAHHGLGSGSCGPDVLPQHRLHAHAATLTVRFHAGDVERTRASAPGN
ncbi:sugar-binding domain-containing protein [Streptomyces sp. NPDC005373]|uniref:sugar-binding domain-containing protein n=1 Tax=Streptomyces sp. NPDC005373 TaxID=3156879 RepID=UPI0033A2D2DC